jgi:hypothetical protein
MTDQDLERFESELRRMKPARPPEGFVVNLKIDSQLAKSLCPSEDSAGSRAYLWLQWLRWLVPATAVIAFTALMLRDNYAGLNRQPASAQDLNMTAAAAPMIKADDVKIDQELVSSFDAVAKLPGGEPVRFRCQQWVDEVVVSDKSQGLMIANRAPRIEVVPIGFETY